MNSELEDYGVSTTADFGFMLHREYVFCIEIKVHLVLQFRSAELPLLLMEIFEEIRVCDFGKVLRESAVRQVLIL